MTTGNQIKYLQHKEIDKAKWDACIDQASNGLIYAYSFYLDCMAKHWDALVLNDYEAVMPLTWNRNIAFIIYTSRLLQPRLVCLVKTSAEQLIGNFLKSIPEKFKLMGNNS